MVSLFSDMTNCMNNDFLYNYIPQIAYTYTVQTVTMFLACYIHMTCWLTTSQRQTRVARRTAFHNIMRQHMGYFDTHKGGELNTRLTE
jgi:ABC-type multidrug transport system fused ATPase/permease subunit